MAWASSGWGQLFTAVLGGLASREEGKDAERQTREATREAGQQNRQTAAFQSDLDYFREMQRRHEASRSLEGNYGQFSTVGNWAPNFRRGPGLDAMPTKPAAGDYK
jgi:hypothetical protein